MKAFFLVLAIGISLKVALSKISVDLGPDPNFFSAGKADALKGSDHMCCHPETMEGSVKRLLQSNQDSGLTFHLDYRNRNFAFHDKFSTGKFILLCDLKGSCLAYDVIESEKRCLKRKLTNVSIDDFWIRCIPRNATRLKSVRLGSDEKAASLLLQYWKFWYKGMETERFVTDIDCIPVVDFVGYDGKSSRSQNYYFNITKRIQDQSVFNPPPYCDKANNMQTDKKFRHLSLFHPQNPVNIQRL